MINKKGIALAAMLLTLTISGPLMAQRRNGNDAQQGQRGNGPDVYAPKPATPEEQKAFAALQAEQSPTNKVALADTFLTTYPNSQLNGYVQRFRMESFGKLGKYKEAAAAGEAGLALEVKYFEGLNAKADEQKNAPKDKKSKNDKNDKNAEPVIDKNSDAFKAFADNTEKAMMYYYQNLMSDYQALNDAPKTIEWAKKALGEQPDDLLTLLTLSSVMAARPSTDPKELDSEMKEAEQHAKKALTMVNGLVNGPAGAQMKPEDKAGLVSNAHQTLGRVYFNTKKYPEAQREYGAAIVAKKDDGDSYFYMGLSFAQDKPPKVDDAMESLAKSVFLKGPSAPQANDVLKQLYQNMKKPMDQYDQFIKDAGAKIGK
jgi:tetratricopeptide (TPR) repeat protein